uniref:Uncharacterized protein n=1 Tax=viral metagenome TaxID=1070528 RepID=A0A6C0E5Z6_9ZZZZ
MDTIINTDNNQDTKQYSKYYQKKLAADPDYFRNKRDKTAEKTKYKEHRDEILEYQKNYNREHRDNILEYQKQYYLDNKEKLCRLAKERQNQPTNCPLCNKTIAKGTLPRHQGRPICLKKQIQNNNIIETTIKPEVNITKKIKLKIVKRLPEQ